MYSVFQHWDPLQVCVLGRSYSPEFYDYIKSPHVRSLFQHMAKETEEDFLAIEQKLSDFGVTVIRPTLPSNPFDESTKKFFRPPMTPRDIMTTVGTKFYHACYNKNYKWYYSGPGVYDNILDHVKGQGNAILDSWNPALINGAQIIRLGKDLFFGTEYYNRPLTTYQQELNQHFPYTRNHVVDTGGHYDGTCCVVAPGLIISGYDAPTYEKTFPGWEVIYLPNMTFAKDGDNKNILTMKFANRKHRGKWWIPGFEEDQEVVNYVDHYLNHWLGDVSETVFDINMLIIDPKNVLVFNYNETVFRALERYGITPHIVPFRHRFFWDGGLHCITSDLHREGAMQDFFTKG
jgi:hypothetical protein